MAENRPGLREMFECHSGAEWLRFDKTDLYPRELPRVAAEVERRFSGLGEVVPRHADLEASHRLVQAAWTRGKGLADVPDRVLRRAPWFVFSPGPDGQPPLAGDAGFARAFRERLLRAGRGSAVAALAKAFLIAYPDPPVFGPWSSMLADLLGELDGPVGRRWRRLDELFHLFRPGGPRRFAGVLLRRSRAVSQTDVLAEVGFDKDLQNSRFLEKAWIGVIEELVETLQEGGDASEILERGLEFLGNGRQLRFPEHRVHLAERLLAAFRARRQPSAAQSRVKNFLLEYYGDPRINRQGWFGVSDAVRSIILQWLVEETLETFFLILDETAKDEHWEARKRFWSHYLKRQLIANAWVVLGPKPARIARRQLGLSEKSFGRLERWGDDKSGYGVLLMRIRGPRGSATVLDWSHNGSFRAWLDGAANSPRLGEFRYEGWALRQGGSFSQVHYKGVWMQAVAAWLRDNLGV